MPKSLDEAFDVGEDGRITDRGRAKWFWDQLQFYKGRRVRLRMGPPKRSGAQNRYYWGVVLETIRQGYIDAGHVFRADALHYHYKAKHLPWRTYEAPGTEHVAVGSTADLDSTEFTEYIEAIRNDEEVLALGVYIPSSEDYQLEHGRFTKHSIAEPD